MEGHPLGPGGEDITWPDQVAPRGRKASSTRKIKPQISNLITPALKMMPLRAALTIAAAASTAFLSCPDHDSISISHAIPATMFADTESIVKSTSSKDCVEVFKSNKLESFAKRCPSVTALNAALTSVLSEERLAISKEEFYSQVREWDATFSREGGWGHTLQLGRFNTRKDGVLGIRGSLMDARHLSHPSIFTDSFGVPIESLRSTVVLDIGPWSGGSSFPLAAMGVAELVVFERNLNRAEFIQFAARAYSFNIRVEAINSLSMHLRNATLLGRFDVVNHLGVLYHQTDPIFSLRQSFASLKRGCVLLLETAGIASDANGKIIRASSRSKFASSTDLSEGSLVRYKVNPKGGNFFNPSAETLKSMLEDVGFENLRVTYHNSHHDRDFVRLYALGQRPVTANRVTRSVLCAETGLTC